MKRLSLLIGAGALCTLALFAIYCAEINYDNPLDEKEKGANTPDAAWLWAIDDTGCVGLPDIYGAPIPPGYNLCGTYIRDNYYNLPEDSPVKTAWKTKFEGCGPGSDSLSIKLVGENPARVVYNHPVADSGSRKFEILMAKGFSFTGAITYTEGANPKAVLTTNGTDEVQYTGNMPPPGTYMIRYEVTKKKCGSEELMLKTETRTLIVTEYTAVDTLKPDITISGCKDSYTEGDTYQDDAGCVSTNTGDPITSKTIKNAAGVTVDAVNTAVPGTFTITYEYCRTLSTGARPCATKTRTVVVNPKQVITYDSSFIVLKKYTYTIGAKQFTTVDTAFALNGTFSGKGVERAYYRKGGVENPITDLSKVKLQSPLPTFTKNDDGHEVRYNLEASPGEYLASAAALTVYITEGCATSPTPRIRFRRPNAAGTGWETLPSTASSADSALTIPAGRSWRETAKMSFSATEMDGEDELTPYRFGVDFGTLNPDNPQPGSSHKITYIALSSCRDNTAPNGLKFVRSVERTVNVQAAAP